MTPGPVVPVAVAVTAAVPVGGRGPLGHLGRGALWNAGQTVAAAAAAADAGTVAQTNHHCCQLSRASEKLSGVSH